MRAEATFPKRHDMADWLSRDGLHGAAAARGPRLLAHVAEPDGSAWTDGKWVVQAVRRELEAPARPAAAVGGRPAARG